MDASKTPGKVVTDMLSLEELAFCKALVNDVEGVYGAWVTGGALMRPESKDVDVIMYMDTHILVEDELPNLDVGGYRLNEVHMNYSGDTDDNVDVIAKMVPVGEGRPFDLLLVSNRHFWNITSYITHNFPLTAQMIAWDIITGEVINQTGSLMGVPPGYITINGRFGPYGAYVGKYMGYYPDATFVHHGKHVAKVGTQCGC